ncbi:MAG: undecaprenyl-diphosphatase UppP [Syntrophales bacterium]|nr:undecaprenyl-diphosphatase UppP [Syntrophales bacterium]
MDIIDALILGIVEGLSEFLPISSTGHLILVSRLLGLTPEDFLKSFEIAIQSGAILAVIVLYWRELMKNRLVMARVMAAFIPTGLLGLIFYPLIKGYLLGSSTVVLWALALGGVAIIVFEILYRGREAKVYRLEKISYKHAFIIGLFQSISMIPGVSRSAATILGGLALGVERKAIVEFSFLLAVPTMIIATVYDLSKSVPQFTFDEMGILLCGMVVSFIVAWASVKFLLRFVQTHTFVPFGIYRLLVALLWSIFI